MTARSRGFRSASPGFVRLFAGAVLVAAAASACGSEPAGEASGSLPSDPDPDPGAAGSHERDGSGGDAATSDARAHDGSGGNGGGSGSLDGGSSEAGTGADAAPFDAGPFRGCGAGVAALTTSLRTTTGFESQADVLAIAAHGDGSVTAGGSLSSRETFGAGTAASVQLQGSQLGSPLVARYDSAGAFLWGKVFATSYGTVTGIGKAADGSVVVSGYFQGSMVVDAGLPSAVTLGTPGAQSGYRPFVVKLAASGALQWARAASNASAFSTAVAVAPDGSSVVAGHYGDSSQNNAITFDATHSLSSAGRWEEIFVVAYDPAGNVRWARQGGSPVRSDSASGAAILTDGSVVVSGTLDRGLATFQGGGKPSRSVTVGSRGYYLARYAASGDLEWLSSGTGDTTGDSVAAAGPTIALAVTGSAGAVLNAGTASANTLPAAARVIAYYAQDGSLQKAVPIMNAISIGGPRRIAVAPDGTVGIAGSYYSQASFTMTGGPLALTPAGWDDGFVACLEPGATGLSWLRSGRGILQDYGTAVDFDGLGRIVAGGKSRDGLSLDTGPATTTSLPARENGFFQAFPR